jgi:glycosyltransferase involved in cell wall biosynthesis
MAVWVPTETLKHGLERKTTDGSVDLARLRVALVHYWLVNRRGGERVVEALAEIFPQADVFTLILDRQALSPVLAPRRITTSFLNRLPGAARRRSRLLPLMPLAVEQFRLDDYDLVISSESGPAKGVITPAHTLHICYCHSPMRYVWDLYHTYREGKGLGPITKAVFTLTAHYVRLWDFQSAARVDHFIANSENVAARIRKVYRREARVIYPAVDLANSRQQDHRDPANPPAYYLVVSQLTDYKRVDLAIDACNRLQRPLRVIGEGEEYQRLARLAGPTVKLEGYQTDEAIRAAYANCRALLFPGEEDFGMVPVEAQARGCPVIAYGRGGALETVLGVSDQRPPEEATGIFFEPQTAEALAEAIRLFESLEHRFSREFLRSHVEKFRPERFRSEIMAFVQAKMDEFQRRGAFERV